MILLYNGILVNEGVVAKGYVAIEGDKINCVGTGEPSEQLMASAKELVDVAGDYILPGAIDDQVHFREPGLTHKADIESESRAALVGGVTSFMDMPNTKPQTITLDELEAKYERAAATSHVNYSFYMGATNDNIDEVKRVDYSKVCGVKAFLGSSTGNMLIDNKSSLERLFSEVGAIIAIHSEDEAIIRANVERYRAEYGDDVPVALHPLIRSAEACYECTARAVELASRVGSRLHVLHLSTAKELSLFGNGPMEQKNITAEVCVHHLWFDNSAYATLGTRIKCNPAVKTVADRNALRAALVDGRIDVVATDHAPHLLSEKEGGALKAASGMPLVQYSLMAMLEMARDGVFSPAQVVDKMCHAPAKLYRVAGRGFLRSGYYADVVIVHCSDEGHIVSDADVVSRCAWTPFVGVNLHYSVKRTYVNGELAYCDGEVNNKVRGSRLLFQ
ncbi:MAG: dihydroorotase [Muribaculaceae bacterium]